MSKDFDSEIINLNQRIRGGYAYLIANMGKIVALVTAIVTAMLVFTDVAFLGFDSKEFTTTLALILVSSYVMYFSLEEAGERLYEDSEEYRNLAKEYSAEVEKIGLEKLPSLRRYCEMYADEELSFRRRAALLSHGYTAEEYQAYLRGEISDKRKRRELGKVARQKRIKLTPEMLLAEGGSAEDRIRDPRRSKLIMLTAKILPSTICMLFTASVVLSAKELTVTSVIEGILKLSTLPIVGFRGYVNGYNYKKGDEYNWLKTKIRLLRGFSEKNANNNLHTE